MRDIFLCGHQSDRDGKIFEYEDKVTQLKRDLDQARRTSSAEIEKLRKLSGANKTTLQRELDTVKRALEDKTAQYTKLSELTEKKVICGCMLPLGVRHASYSLTDLALALHYTVGR